MLCRIYCLTIAVEKPRTTDSINQFRRVCVCVCVRANFQAKQIALTCSDQISPKMDLGLESQKTNVEIRMIILKILCAPIFRQNGQLSVSWPKFPKNWILEMEFQKSKCRFGISTSKIPSLSRDWNELGGGATTV